jgi:hypothetical protein
MDGCKQQTSRSSLKQAGSSAQAVTVNLKKGDDMSFGIYAVGFAIMICGLMYGAHLMHIPAHWIAVGAIVLLGVGILSGVKATRQRDSSK